MFDGKTFLPVTGMPIRKMACMIRPLADADPVPFAVAILNAKSLTRSIDIPCIDPIIDNPPQRHEGHEDHIENQHAFFVSSRLRG